MLRRESTTRRTKYAFVVSSCAAALFLAGCSADFSRVTAPAGPIATTGSGDAAVNGSVHGGQQPVSGATVQLWAAGTTGYGSTPMPLGSAVTTDQNGGFTLGSFTCPANSYTYITAAGGNPQISDTSTNNDAITLVAALGPCSGLGSTTFININEVTTVAAVWAMAPFAGVSEGTALDQSSSSSPSDAFGTSSTNLQGLANAMGVAQILANNATGASPGTNSSGNISNIEYWQVNTLADILALCVNSNGVSDTSCSPVVTATTGGTAPADTVQMALYLAQNPTQALTLLSDVSSVAPFQPYDSSVNDWTIGYAVPTGSFDSRWIAIDEFGNAWVSTSGAGVVELDPTGNLISTPTSYTLTGQSSSTTIGTAYEVAVDTANNAWFSDETKNAIFEIKGSDSAGGANAGAGTAVSTPSGADLEGIVVDGNDNVWAAASGKNVVGVLNGQTTLTTGGTVTSSPFGMAVDLSNQPAFGNTSDSGGGSFLYTLDSGGCSGLVTVDGTSGTGGSIAMDFTEPTTIGSTNYAAGAATPLNYIVDTSCNNTTNVAVNSSYSTPRVFMSTPYGIAFDHSNNMWIVNASYTSTTDTSSGHYSLTKLAAQNYSTDVAFTGADAEGNFTFTSISGVTGGLNAPYYLAMDGAGAAWVGNSAGAGLSAFTNSGTAISPTTGFSGGTCSSCTTTMRQVSSSRGVAVDGSGNVWEANTGAHFVTVVVGVATPTVTPLSLGIKNGTLASEP